MFDTIRETMLLISGYSPEPVDVKYAPGPEHIHTSHNVWTLSGWKENEVQFRNNHIIDDIEKLQTELYYDLVNDRVTTARPTYLQNTDNIGTLIGFTESAKRDTGETSTTLTHNSIGTGTTTATENDTDLETEDSGGSYARQAYSGANGQRKVVNQTAKYGMKWDETVISAAGLIITESGVHWHLSDGSKCHARVNFTAFELNSGDLFVTQINELHQNG